MHAAIVSLLLLVLVVALAFGTGGPTEEELRGEVVTALDALAAGLAEDRPIDEAAYMERLRSYLDDHPAFYGSAAALLDRDGRVTASPYVYRSGDGYATPDLAVPSYNIDYQAWVTEPLAESAGVWTAPYFDAGGGEIWMVTRSVPVRDAEGIFALVTTVPLSKGKPRLGHQLSTAAGPSSRRSVDAAIRHRPMNRGWVILVWPGC